MKWKPIPLADLQALVARGLAECPDEERDYFARVALAPERWSQSPWGDEGGGFWAVAVDEDRVLWYNDIEEGFNVSRFVRRGEIPSDEYWCDQSPLRNAIPLLQGRPGYRNGPPQPFVVV